MNIEAEKISIRKAPYAKIGLSDMIDYIENHTRKNFSDFVMVEIGSFVGDSSEVFAKRCKTIHCIDPWLNGYDDNDTSSYKWPMSQIEKQFDELCRKYPNIIKHKMTSVKGADLFENESIDFIYIDGKHTKEAAKEDALTWLPKLKKPGYIAGHDFENKCSPGVKLAITEVFMTIDKLFRDTSWIKHIK
jgi:hypothetical protein